LRGRAIDAGIKKLEETGYRRLEIATETNREVTLAEHASDTIVLEHLRRSAVLRDDLPDRVIGVDVAEVDELFTEDSPLGRPLAHESPQPVGSLDFVLLPDKPEVLKRERDKSSGKYGSILGLTPASQLTDGAQTAACTREGLDE
jgi:hypothetical protein